MANAIFYDALVAIETALINLGLTGLDTTRIKVRRLPHDGEHYFPGVTIHPTQERYFDGTNMREDIGYGCSLTMVQNNNNNSADLLNRVLQWRETIRQYFVENDTLGSGTTIFTLKVEHGDVFTWDGMIKDNYDVSVLTIRVWSRESRT